MTGSTFASYISDDYTVLGVDHSVRRINMFFDIATGTVPTTLAALYTPPPGYVLLLDSAQAASNCVNQSVSYFGNGATIPASNIKMGVIVPSIGVFAPPGIYPGVPFPNSLNIGPDSFEASKQILISMSGRLVPIWPFR